MPYTNQQLQSMIVKLRAIRALAAAIPQTVDRLEDLAETARDAHAATQGLPPEIADDVGADVIAVINQVLPQLNILARHADMANRRLHDFLNEQERRSKSAMRRRGRKGRE